MSNWTILCDFDGTVSVEDITDSLLERFARPGWQTIEQAWRRGEIGSHDCMAEQVALFDASREEIDAHLDSMMIDRAFPAFVAEAENAGVPLAIVSDGLDYAIRRILDSHGLGRLPIIANRLESDGPRSWRLDFPFGSPTCRIASGNCKCACAGRARDEERRVLLIGDGASDFCVAGEADLVFAKHRLIEHCRSAGIAYVPITGFADALDLLPTLLAGEIAAQVTRHEPATTA
ncbi:MAG TPA: MtnX-like HAD-IB family phosphatase [Rhodanobacteraceae bacterium]|nr:MtnX-like HAD-IB family phosphatase [Rhodanobacteraceae bacterium]